MPVNTRCIIRRYYPDSHLELDEGVATQSDDEIRREESEHVTIPCSPSPKDPPSDNPSVKIG